MPTELPPSFAVDQTHKGDHKLREGLKGSAQLKLFALSERPAEPTTSTLTPKERAREIEPFYTLKEAAAHLNLKPWHLVRMAKRNEFPVYRAGSRRMRVHLSEVAEAIRRSSEPQS